jgi:phytoene dehydrogenase-like protein
MKAIIIGSGLSGLTAALTLAKAGWKVEIFEQADEPGGVTRGCREQGYQWEYGQLNIEAIGASEPVGEVLSDLGVLSEIQVLVDNREYTFPDFALPTPAQYRGLQWRIDLLKQQFPEEAGGLDRYWNDYVRFTRLLTYARRMERAPGFGRLAAQANFYLSLLPLLPKKDWSAEKLAAHYFQSEKLRCVFISILADFFTLPSQFIGLGVFALNAETFFEKRMPSHLANNAEMLHLYSIRGGMPALVRALVDAFQANGGLIHTSCAVAKVTLKDGRASGVIDTSGAAYASDVVVASGGVNELFTRLVDSEHLSPDFIQKVKAIPLMDSVFMLHLGLDIDPSPYLRATSSYFYGTYDVEGEIERARQGIYHEGAGGFVVHFPSLVSPESAPAGKYALTVYTICPDRLAESSWEAEKERLADRLLEYTEKYIPGLRDHILVRKIVTPDDFRQITHLDHHAFGGLAPVMGAWRAPHQTPVPGLWFIGAQSESGGGMNNVIPSANKVARKIAAIQGVFVRADPAAAATTAPD